MMMVLSGVHFSFLNKEKLKTDLVGHLQNLIFMRFPELSSSAVFNFIKKRGYEDFEFVSSLTKIIAKLSPASI